MGIVQLFQAVYGENYPIRIFYDAAALTAANAEGLNHSIVARNPSGKVIGITNIFPSMNNKSIYEWGAGLVLKEYRNSGVNMRLSRFLHDTFIPRHPEIEGLLGEPVCNHVHLQKMVDILGYVEMAIELALMPGDADREERSTEGRVATLTAFRCYRPKPHRIFLPAVYEEELQWCYARLDDKRDIRLSEQQAPAGVASSIEMTVFDFAQVARISVREVGADFQACLDGLEEEARMKNVVVFQAALNLACPWVEEAVEELRRRGYFFGGTLPRWLDTDAFLMQKLICPPNFDSIILFSDPAKRLLEIIHRDWKRAETAAG